MASNTSGSKRRGGIVIEINRLGLHGRLRFELGRKNESAKAFKCQHQSDQKQGNSQEEQRSGPERDANHHQAKAERDRC